MHGEEALTEASVWRGMRVCKVVWVRKWLRVCKGVSLPL